ncbi:MAG: hypothetical protein PVI40_07280, partial [Chlamydiota bacterium]
MNLLKKILLFFLFAWVFCFKSQVALSKVKELSCGIFLQKIILTSDRKSVRYKKDYDISVTIEDLWVP